MINGLVIKIPNARIALPKSELVTLNIKIQVYINTIFQTTFNNNIFDLTYSINLLFSTIDF